MEFTALHSSPLGTILLKEMDGSITYLGFTQDAPGCSFPTPLLARCAGWLDGYFAGKAPDPRQIPISLHGTPFQRQVWDLLMKIPYGQSITYRQIAKAIHPAMSAQTVGRAVGSNPVSILVPCHRVLGAGGNLTGYAFGLERKRVLLTLENIPYK